MRVVGEQEGVVQDRKPLPQGANGHIGAAVLQHVEGGEPEGTLLPVLDRPRIRWARCEDRDGGLEGVRRDRVAGVDGGERTDQFAVEDGADQPVEPDGLVCQVRLELAEPEVHLADGSAGIVDPENWTTSRTHSMAV